MPDLLFPNIIKNQSSAQTSFRFRNPEERQLHAWVNAEVEDMIDYARPARELGSDAIQGYMSVVHKARSRKEKSDITFPLLHSVIYSRQAIEAARAPKVHFKARTDADRQNMKYIEAAIAHDERGSYNRPSVDHTYFEQTFDKNLLGVGGVYVGFEFQTQVMHVFDPIKQKWVEKKCVVSDDIVERNIDFFNFGVSRDMKPGMFGGRASYWDQFFDESTFFSTFGNNPYYENISRDKIPDGDWFMGAGDGLKKPKMWKRIYRVRYYWDIVHDLLYTQCNGIPIRHSYILDYGDYKNPMKMIPIATIHNDFSYEHHRESGMANLIRHNNRFYDTSSSVNTSKTFWSKSEALISKPMIAAKNSFGRSMVDFMKAAGVHFVMGPSAIIEKINKGRLYGIEPIPLDAGEFNTKSLVQGSTFLNDFRVADDYFSKINTAALGRDIGRIARSNPPQATVAAMEQEAEERRDVQNAQFNATGGITRKYWLKYIMVKQYYPMPKKVRINSMGEIEDIDEYRVLRDHDGRPMLYLHPKKVSLDHPVVEKVDMKRVKVKDENGTDRVHLKRSVRLLSPDHSDAKGENAQNFFTAREELFMTNEDPEIEIEDQSSFQRKSAMEKAVATEQLQALQPFFTMVRADGTPLLPTEAQSFILQHIARAFGMPFDELMSNLSQTDEQREEDEIAPPPYADQQDLLEGQGSGVVPSAGGPQFQGGAVSQTSASGSPPKSGGALNSNAALAAAVTG